MPIDQEQEFWFNFIMFGGIITVLLALGIFFMGVRWKTNNKITKHKIVKELYNEKERTNGQSKGGAHGHY